LGGLHEKDAEQKMVRQQNMLINSVMKSASQDVRLYIKVKKLSGSPKP
jgi:hypothetical protein